MVLMGVLWREVWRVLTDGLQARAHQGPKWASSPAHGLTTKQEMMPPAFHTRKGLHVGPAHGETRPASTPSSPRMHQSHLDWGSQNSATYRASGLGETRPVSWSLSAVICKMQLSIRPSLDERAQ